jgi:hypothetical protein
LQERIIKKYKQCHNIDIVFIPNCCCFYKRCKCWFLGIIIDKYNGDHIKPIDTTLFDKIVGNNKKILQSIESELQIKKDCEQSSLNFYPLANACFHCT